MTMEEERPNDGSETPTGIMSAMDEEEEEEEEDNDEEEEEKEKNAKPSLGGERRLSIGEIGLRPLHENAGEPTSPPRSRSGVPSFFRQKGTVHPLPSSDIESGGSGRKIRFSAAVTAQRDGSPEKGSWRMTAREAFRIIDENGDGFLQKEEVVRAIEMMVEYGEMNLDGQTTLEMAEKMMDEVDVDGDGQIDMDEFTEMMKKTSTSLGTAGDISSYNHRMSQLAKNVLIAHQKKIENSVVGSDMWLVHPLSNFHATWDIIVSLLILLTVITMPLSLGWEELNEFFFAMNLTVDFVFLFDVCKNFCTGYIDENEAIVMNARMVRKNYVRGFFVTDFCSSIPLDLILKWAGVDSVDGTVTGTKQSLKMLKLLRMAKLFRLLRINRLFLHIKRVMLLVEETLQIRISDGFTKLMRLGVGALVLAHWIGCFNFLLVRLHDFPSDSWVVYSGLDKVGPFKQWSWSFFKALAQMIMIGFETPPFTNVSCDALTDWCTLEYWITLGCLYLGAIFYSLLISSVSSILHSANQASRQFDEKLGKIDDYMRTKKLPAAMREKVKDYFYLQSSNGKLHNEEEILDFLSPVLRREIKCFTAREICQKVPLLFNRSAKEFAADISSILEPTIVFANEVILREGQTGDEMFFICSGVVEIFVSGSGQVASYVSIGDGCYFGEVSVLLGVKRTASVRTKTQCLLYRVRKNRLVELLHDYPSIDAKMKRVAASRKKRLAHYLNPKKVPLAPGDEVDPEDSKTSLFGCDQDEIMSDKAKNEREDRVAAGRLGNRTSSMATPTARRNANISRRDLGGISGAR